MLTTETILFFLLGFIGIVYAFKSDQLRFSLTDHLPGPLANRKILFVLGFAIVVAGFASAYVIGSHHGFIALFGSWIMLVGSAPWFNKRCVRKFFDPAEWKVIRTTIYAGIVISLLSTGFFYLPPVFSPGPFLIGIAIIILSGRLWWKQDIEDQYRVMQHSKRN
jgi:hypothetical protein